MPRSRSHKHSKPPSDSESLDEFRRQIHDRMRASALQTIYQIFEEEVEALCGKRYSSRSPGLPRRAGSDMGCIFLEGQRVAVRKPRVKKDGKEVHLPSYQRLKNGEIIFPDILNAMLSGVSTRDYINSLPLMPGSKGLSRTSVSRAFKKISRKALDEMNSRDLSESDVVVLIMDGIHFGKRAIISALGLNTKGHN